MKNVAPVITYRVTMGGGAAGRRSVPVEEDPGLHTEAVAASNVGAPRIGETNEPATWRRFVSDLLADRSVTTPLAVAGFLVLINVFTGLHRMWFHWPVAVLLFIVILRTVNRRRSPSDRREERRTSRE
jgi:adenylate cyclase